MSVVKKCFKLLQLKQHFDKGLPEREVISYLKSWNNKLKSDEYGNLFLINPGKPLLNAHMDTVQSEQCVKNLRSLRLKNWVIKASDAVIWGDDKCWIAIAMEIYEKLGNEVSLLFTRQEETGCNWAREFCEKHPDLIQLCPYCLTLDRRGSWDIIGYSNQYCSKEFQDEIHRLTKEFGYKPEHWLCSDANKISKFINCVNLSVGYYNPHQKTEYIKCEELVNAYEAAMYIVTHLDWSYPIYEAPKFEAKTYNSWKQSAYSKWYYNTTLFDDDDDEDDYDKYSKYYWYYWKKTKAKDAFELKGNRLIVKKNVYLTNKNDFDDRSELAIWEYDICEY